MNRTKPTGERDEPSDDMLSLGKGWIELQRRHFAGESTESVFWAYSAMDELCDRNPKQCFQQILTILDIDSSELILGTLAAGPLEDLLSRHGVDVVDQIETESRRNPKLKVLLTGVWRNVIDEDVWNRIQALANSA